VLYIFPVSVAHAAGEGGGFGSSGIAGMAPFVLLIVVFYFLLIRPQQKTAKKHKELLASLSQGDRIITRGGVHGRVQSVKEATVMVEIAPNVTIKLERGAVLGTESESGSTDKK
jgi:preprotein translocase subunit YajC